MEVMVSRQRRWQLKQQEENRCMICGRKSRKYKGYCKLHRELRNAKRRKKGERR
jgi:hypothetical protein